MGKTAPQQAAHAHYFRQLSRYEAMSRDEELVAATRLADLRRQVEAGQNGSLPATEFAALERELKEARNAFVRANLRLVVKIAMRYDFGALPLSDLIQEGNLGLMTAVERFDAERGVRFCTYATWWIRHRVSRTIANHGRSVRVPTHIAQAQLKIRKERRKHVTRHGAEPSLAELSAATGLTEDKIILATAAGREAVRLDALIGQDEDQTRHEVMPSPGPSAEEMLARHDAERGVRAALESLTPIERDVVDKRFALDAAGSTLTLREIGEQHGLSRERIRQLQLRALGKLRALLTPPPLPQPT